MAFEKAFYLIKQRTARFAALNMGNPGQQQHDLQMKLQAVMEVMSRFIDTEAQSRKSRPNTRHSITSGGIASRRRRVSEHEIPELFPGLNSLTRQGTAEVEDPDRNVLDPEELDRELAGGQRHHGDDDLSEDDYEDEDWEDETEETDGYEDGDEEVEEGDYSEEHEDSWSGSHSSAEFSGEEEYKQAEEYEESQDGQYDSETDKEAMTPTFKYAQPQNIDGDSDEVSVIATDTESEPDSTVTPTPHHRRGVTKHIPRGRVGQEDEDNAEYGDYDYPALSNMGVSSRSVAGNALAKHSQQRGNKTVDPASEPPLERMGQSGFLSNLGLVGDSSSDATSESDEDESESEEDESDSEDVVHSEDDSDGFATHTEDEDDDDEPSSSSDLDPEEYMRKQRQAGVAPGYASSQPSFSAQAGGQMSFSHHAGYYGGGQMSFSHQASPQQGGGGYMDGVYVHGGDNEYGDETETESEEDESDGSDDGDGSVSYDTGTGSD